MPVQKLLMVLLGSLAEHDLHNFVAGGVLVHNKTFKKQITCAVPCVLPDGGSGLVDCPSNVSGNSGSCE